jgi:hypothetical protein
MLQALGQERRTLEYEECGEVFDAFFDSFSAVYEIRAGTVYVSLLPSSIIPVGPTFATRVVLSQEDLAV